MQTLHFKGKTFVQNQNIIGTCSTCTSNELSGSIQHGNRVTNKFWSEEFRIHKGSQ